MKNLEVLSKQELKQTNGGNWYRFAGPIGLALAILSTDWDQVVDDMGRGFNDAQK